MTAEHVLLDWARARAARGARRRTVATPAGRAVGRRASSATFVTLRWSDGRAARLHRYARARDRADRSTTSPTTRSPPASHDPRASQLTLADVDELHFELSSAVAARAPIARARPTSAPASTGVRDPHGGCARATFFPMMWEQLADARARSWASSSARPGCRRSWPEGTRVHATPPKRSRSRDE